MDINDINIAKRAIQQINNSDYKHVDEFNDWIQKQAKAEQAETGRVKGGGVIGLYENPK